EGAREHIVLVVADHPTGCPVFIVVPAQALLIARGPASIPSSRAPVGIPIFLAPPATTVRASTLATRRLGIGRVGAIGLVGIFRHLEWNRITPIPGLELARIKVPRAPVAGAWCA